MDAKNSLIYNLRPYLLIAIAPLCWAGNIVLARGLIHTIPPVSLAFWRWAIAFLILLPFTWKHAVKDFPRVKQHWKIICLLSFFGITCFNTLLYRAMHTTTAINGALIQTTMPAFIILITLLMFREKIRTIQVVGVILCVSGALWVVLRGDVQALMELSFSEGDLLMIVAVVLYASYSALLRKRPKIHPLSFLTYTFGIGIMGLLPLYVWEILCYASFELTPGTVSSILYVAVFPSIVAYLCWNRGIDVLGANRAGLFINLIPVFASILAVIWLDEVLKAFHIAGMTLIFGGMVLFNQKG